MGGNNKCSLVVMSGDMDRIMGAFIIATGAAAALCAARGLLPRELPAEALQARLIGGERP